MPNQKGSLKDRLRSWQMFLRYKYEQRKKLREIKRKKKQLLKEKQLLATGKYYSKPKVLGLTIIGLFFSLFEHKSKKEEKTNAFRYNSKKINIDFEITKLEIKMKNNKLTIEDIKTIENLDKLLGTKKSTYHINNKEINYTKRLNVIKENLKEEKVIVSDSIIKMENKENKIDNKEIKIKSNDMLKNAFEKNKLKNNNLNENIKYPKKRKSYGVYIPVLEVKELNKNLDKCSKKIDNLKSMINKENEYNNLFDYTFEIKQLKIKIEEILVKYESLKQLPGFKELENYIKIKDIDLYEIRKSDKKIKDKINLCNETLLQIEERKKEIIVNENNKPKQNENVNNKPNNKEVKEETKKEIKREVKDNKLVEVELANKIIYDNLIKEQRKVAKLERMLFKVSVKKRKPTVFYYTKNLVSSIFNLTFSLFPLNLFKNKMLGGLASGIMLNNSLRSVKRILKPEVEVTYLYYNLEKEISSTANYLNRMDFLLSDSLDKVNDIRSEVLNKYGHDIAYRDSLNAYLDELSKIQSKIEFERAKVLGLNQDLNQVYKKNKQKVLTINKYNSQ